MSSFSSTFPGKSSGPWQKFPSEQLLKRQLSKKASTKLICQVGRQTRLEIFSKLPKVAQDLVNGQKKEIHLWNLDHTHHIHISQSAKRLSPLSSWCWLSFRYCQADGSWSPKVLPECKRESAFFFSSNSHTLSFSNHCNCLKLSASNSFSLSLQRFRVRFLSILPLAGSCTTVSPTTLSSGSRLIVVWNSQLRQC